MQSLLRGVESLDAPLQAQVLAGLAPELLGRIRAATPVAWMPLTENVQLAEAIASCLGEQRARPFFREVLLLEYQSSLLKPFVDGISRALGVTPAIFVRMAPKGWELVYRDCGVLEGSVVSEREATLVLSDLPLVCVRNKLWLDAVRSTFYTAFDLSHVQGEIDWVELNFAGRRATMRFHWHNASA
jgi:hypothetical protein